jgi:HK97 family phage prohead protease
MTDTSVLEASIGLPELRYCIAPITHIDVRDSTGTDDGSWTMSGYAAVFNQETVLYDGSFVRIKEIIDAGAFNSVLAEQPMTSPEGVVHLNIGHDMNRAVAATDVDGIGGLQLAADSHGLHFLARVDREDPDGIAMAVKMRRGVIKQASFAFTVAKSQWLTTENDDGPDEDLRTILEMKHLYDVCSCAQGAYPQTVSQLRSMAAAIGQPAGAGGQPRQPNMGGASDVSPSKGRAADHEAWQERMRTRIAVSRHHHPSLKETA